MITVNHRVPGEQLALGLVRVEGVKIAPAGEALRAAIRQAVEARRAPLSADDEHRRLKSRDMLRNGKYKPTGRGKPASEYLLRAATQQEFPSINGPVDVINLVSLRYLVPISLWDLARAASDTFEFRLGGDDESYVFNATGQSLSLTDLVCGCAEGGAERSRPLVSPIKDCQATKTDSTSERLAACIYYPRQAGPAGTLQKMVDELRDGLAACGADSAVGAAVIETSGDAATL